MEKKKILNRVNNIVLLMIVGLFIGLLVLQVVLFVFGIGISLSVLTYWIFLIGYSYLVIKFKISGKTSLLAAISLFVISAILTVVWLRNVGEMVMRYFLILWIVGLAQTMVEYKKHAKK